MTEVLDAPVYPHGVVVGRYLTAVADTTGDPDRLMDFTPATGKVTFTPVSANHIYEGPQPAIITQKAVTCKLDEQGYLTDPNGLRGVHLIVGVYNVAFSIDGAAIPGPQKIQVAESHTLESPLDLVLSAPQIVPPGSVIVVNESTAQRAEAAAQRAESYVDSLDTKVEEILSTHPELEGPTGIGVESISDTDGDGIALVTYTDGRTSELPLPEGPKGDQGIPGNPSQYILVGPGRPDTPTTTGGIITGNEPVGAEYRSTDGAQVGAYVWMKRPGGVWAVVDGDTGWRSLTIGGAWAAVLTDPSPVHIRRTAIDVRIIGRLNIASTPPGWATALGDIPAGFRAHFPLGSNTQPTILMPVSDFAVPKGWMTYIGWTHQIAQSGGSSMGTGNRSFSSNWAPSDPWPSTLPGSPA